MSFDPEQSRLLTNLGASIRRVRVDSNMTQERLAELASVNTRTIQKIEAGKLNILITTLARIQDALDCRWEELLGNAAKIPPSRKQRGQG